MVCHRWSSQSKMKRLDIWRMKHFLLNFCSRIMQGNFLLNGSQDFLITDPNWLASMIHLFTNSKAKSSDFKEVGQTIEDPVPVWKYDELKNELLKSISADKVIQNSSLLFFRSKYASSICIMCVDWECFEVLDWFAYV